MVDLEDGMSGNSVLTLRTYPSALIRIACPKCNRTAQYSRSSLLQRFSDDMPMTDLLDALTSCPLWGDASDPCQMHSRAVLRTRRHDRAGHCTARLPVQVRGCAGGCRAPWARTKPETRMRMCDPCSKKPG